MHSTNDMTVGSPLRAIIKFAIPLILGYILQQMYLIIDAAIVGRWIGVGALAAVGASSSIMFLIMGFCNGSCAGFAIPIAQAFGAKDYAKMRAYVSNSIRIAVVFAVVITIYIVQAIRSRGKPKVERKGAGLLGSYGGMGAPGGKPTGAGAMGGVPGMTALYGRKNAADPPEEPEDPRRR